MFVNKLKMDEIAEAVKKCMDEADLEETGLRKAAYAAHTKGEKMFSFKGKTYPVKVQGEEVSYGKEIKEASCEDEVKKHEKRLHGKDGEVSKHVDKMHKEELSHKQKKIAKLNHPKDEIDAGDLAKLRGEEAEQIDELKKSTMGSYVKKASKDLHNTSFDHGEDEHRQYGEPDGPYGNPDAEADMKKRERDIENRQKGINRAATKLSKEEVELDEADKVATSTGMKVYGSSYGDSAKARRDQLKRPVDDTKGPNKSQLAQMAKVKKEEFFKDRLITNYIEEEAQFEAELQEVLSKDATAGDYISDFVHSDNPKFAGKSVKKRQKMALAAYYAKKRNESVDDSYPVTTDTVAGRMPGGMSNTFKQFKVKVSAKDKEAAETKNRIPNSDPMNMTAREPHVGHGGLVSIPPAGIVRKEEVEHIEETKGAQAMKSSGVKQSPDKLLARTGMNMAHKFPRKGQTNLGNIPGINTPGVSKDTADYAEKRRGDRAKQLKPAIKAALGTHGPKGKLPEEVELNEVSKSEVEHHFNNWTNSEHAPYNKDAGDDNKVHQSALRYMRSTNVPKENHEKMAMHIAHKFHGSGIDESTPPKNTDIADKSYLKDMGKKPTVKSDLKNFKNFLTGKKETNEGKQPETDNVPFVTNADQPPFDGPYKKIDKTTTDKSGAKHTPMSRARDLAQAAMKRVKTEMLGKAPGNNG
jgi:hypothetical protein